MKAFSRRMPKLIDAPWTYREKATTAIVALAVVLALLWSASFRSAVLGLAVIIGLAWLYQDRRLRRVSVERQGEDIGSFAKAFDRRAPEFDPWVIRAVWDALQPYRTHRGGVAPLRPSDSLKSFLDVDDVYEQVASDVAQRAGRSLDSPEANPKYGKVETVADLVQFFWHQPTVVRPTGEVGT